MGAADDELAVVDPELRIRGLEGIRIADASVFPTMPAVNPMIGVLMVGEKAADLIRSTATVNERQRHREVLRDVRVPEATATVEDAAKNARGGGGGGGAPGLLRPEPVEGLRPQGGQRSRTTPS